jgi:hypothetical protein
MRYLHNGKTAVLSYKSFHAFQNLNAGDSAEFAEDTLPPLSIICILELKL